MSPWEKLLERPHSRGHFVQLYEADEVALTKNVGLYLWEGLRRGEGAVVIVTPEHRELFSRHLDHLGADLPALLGSRQLVFWDAQQTLAQFMDAGQPDWRSFESAIRAAMRQVRPSPGSEGLRAYGEMVGILWKARQFAAAIRLEQLWNRLLEQSSFSLYCAHTRLMSLEKSLRSAISMACFARTPILCRRNPTERWKPRLIAPWMKSWVRKQTRYGCL
jgi:hypothetical protein